MPQDLVSLSHQSLSSGTAVFGLFFLTLPQGVSGEAEDESAAADTQPLEDESADAVTKPTE